MVKKCLNCNLKYPNYNLPGKTKAFCKDCKTDDMIDVSHTKCITCKIKRPSFNNIGKKNTLYCADCKTDDMVDVISKMCCKCNLKHPIFNIPGEKQGKYCLDCKTNEMVDVKNKKCIICKQKIPNFNIPSKNNGEYCADCKTDEMVDVKNKKCKQCDNVQISHSIKKYKGYCLRCFIYLFPDEPVSRNYKTKEYAVVEYIKENFEKYKWIYNKKIYGGVSNRLPDLFLELKNQIIIIEIDENQHNFYDCSCDNKRLMEISLDVKHKPIVFIRFNPDGYIDKDDKKVKSCWMVTKTTGIIKISSENKWKERLNKLKEEVEYWLENDTNKTLEVIELYYDQNRVV